MQRIFLLNLTQTKNLESQEQFLKGFFPYWIDTRLEKSKILLFVYQRTAHPVNLKLQNMRMEFLLANCRSKIQPCDLGII